jgi:hypothetical protein
MAVRIEDAGFEIRDMIAWCYGSGFPKSLDVSKAIDKAAGHTRATDYEPNYANATFGKGMGGGKHGAVSEPPCTESAQQWQGWGTALKPALEPITVARKPLIGTVAQNVLEHGTGAINVDGCRINNLTGQRPIGSFSAWGKEKNLCDLCARLAESHVKQETPETRACSAESHAEPITSGRVGNTPVDTAKENTGCSAGPSLAEPETSPTANFNLSIGVSGKIPTGQSLLVTKSTTSTETAQTTELKTCNACGCSITDQCTNENMPVTKSAMQNMQNGRESAGPTGRWPSNFIHDGSDEVVELFPVTSASKATPRNNGDFKSVAKGRDLPHVTYGHDDNGGSAARFFYCAKTSKKDRNEGCEHLPEHQEGLQLPRGKCSDCGAWKNSGEEKCKCGGEWEMTSNPPPKANNNHPTVKPTDLMRYLCRLVTQPNGVVLDPFMGSGSTGKAAMIEGFQFIGIERDESYFEIARSRIEAASERLL